MDFKKIITDAAKGAAQNEADKVKRGAEQAARNTVQRPLENAVQGAMGQVQQRAQGALSGAFASVTGALDLSKLGNAFSSIKDQFINPNGAATAKLIEQSLAANGFKAGNVADGKLDKASLDAMNKFLVKEGRSSIKDWSNLSKDDLRLLVERTGQKPNGAAALGNLDAAMNELGARASTAAAAVQNPADALRQGAAAVNGAAASAAGTVGDIATGVGDWFKRQQEAARNQPKVEYMKPGE